MSLAEMVNDAIEAAKPKVVSPKIRLIEAGILPVVGKVMQKMDSGLLIYCSGMKTTAKLVAPEA